MPAVCAAASRASNACATRSRTRSATSRLGSSGSSSLAPARSRIVTRFVSVPNPEPASLTSFATRRSTPFAWSLAAARSREPVSAAKPTSTGAAAPVRPASAELAAISASRSGVGVSSRVRPSARAILRSAGEAGREVGDRGGHDERIGSGGVGRAHRGRERIAQLGGRLDAHDLGGLGQRDLDGRGDQRDAGAPRERRLGEGDAHLAGRSVADVADRVDRLARAAGGDHDRAPDEVGLARDGAGERRAGQRRPAGGSGGRRRRRRPRRRCPAARPGGPCPDCPEASGPDSGATPCSRTPRAAARRSRRSRDASTCRRPSPARRPRARCVARAVAVTTSPARPFAIAPEPVGGRRRDDDRVGRVGDDDVADPTVGQEVEHVGLDRVARQRRERQRPDEPGRAGREQDDDVRALGGQEPEQLDGLVRGDRAGDAERDEPALEAPRRGDVAHESGSSSGCPPATSAWRIARPLSVRSGSIASTPSSARRPRQPREATR